MKGNERPGREERVIPRTRHTSMMEISPLLSFVRRPPFCPNQPARKMNIVPFALAQGYRSADFVAVAKSAPKVSIQLAARKRTPVAGISGLAIITLPLIIIKAPTNSRLVQGTGGKSRTGQPALDSLCLFPPRSYISPLLGCSTRPPPLPPFLQLGCA